MRQNQNFSLPLALCLSLSSLCLSSCVDREYRLRFWEKCRIAGEQAFRKKHYRYAHLMALEAVCQAEGFGESDFRLGVSLCDLGDAEKALGKAKKAESAYKRSMKVLESALEQAKLDAEKDKSQVGKGTEKQWTLSLLNEDLANSLAHLADLYAMQANYAESAGYFKKAAYTYEGILRADKWHVDDNPLAQRLVQSLIGAAQVYLAMNDLESAEQAYAAALQYAASSSSPEFVLQELKKADIEILKKEGKGDSVGKLLADEEWAISSSRGMRAFLKADYIQAELYFRNAYLAAEKSIFSERRMLRSYFNLAAVFSKQGKVLELERVCQSALAFMRLHPQSGFSADYDQILSTEAMLYMNMGKVEALKAPLLEQLQYRVKYYGANSLQVCETLALLAQTQLKLADRTTAEKNAFLVYRIIKNRYMSNKRAGAAMQDLAQVLSDLKHLPEAEEMFLQSMNVQLKRMNPHDARIVGAKTSIFIFYRQHGERSKAMKIAKEVSSLVKTAPAEQRIAAFPYLVLMLSYCCSADWFEEGALVAQAGQSILRHELGEKNLDSNASFNWKKDILILEKHFACKF
ncbi:MAG: hypothetical protein K2X27_23230 [Candidatus Obscuribacterales bacterium]|nr:hypothetical protein [Candidatus Obscuribacterales bacterium]